MIKKTTAKPKKPVKKPKAKRNDKRFKWPLDKVRTCVWCSDKFTWRETKRYQKFCNKACSDKNSDKWWSWQPTVMTIDTLAKLKEWFLMWLTDREACLYADISVSSLMRYIDGNPDYWKQREVRKDQPRIHAKMAITNALKPTTKGERKVRSKDPSAIIYGSTGIATRYLERKSSDEFSTKQVIDNQWNMKHEMVKSYELSDTATKKLDALLSKTKAWRWPKHSTTTEKKSKKS